jgi:hypothetical protein
MGVSPNQDFNADLAVNGGVPFKKRGIRVSMYKNLSYNANLVLYNMQQLEELGTYYFHCAAMNVLMTVSCTGFRPMKPVGNNKVEPESMCCHFLVYGAQGVGKSHLLDIMMCIFPGFFDSITYTSLRASYGAMNTDDATDNTAIFCDEAAAWKVGGKRAAFGRPEDAERTVQEKELMSKGEVKGHRLERPAKEEPMQRVTYHTVSHHAPRVELTNAPPGRNDPSVDAALLDRYRYMYLQRAKRLVKHSHQVRAAPQGASGPLNPGFGGQRPPLMNPLFVR